QFTASEQLRGKLQQAQELLRRQVPDGDLASICERALDLLLESLVKKRFALGNKRRGKAQRRQRRPSAATRQELHHDSKGDRAATAVVADEASSGEPESVSSMAGQGEIAAGNIDKHGGGNRKQASAKRSRYIPAAVRRQVAKRDGLQCRGGARTRAGTPNRERSERCTYVGPDGHRCQCRDVEFHHLTPFARGGEHSAEELTLRCRAH
ncbi:MAG: hypothetical protein GY841_16595, partial [FCB group bacterium]|nr:hypothetical protein [FCB group bacterium]